ncbi:MAG: hypothetical protein AAF692_05895 [Pseudomonadota bacterium]
MSCVELHIQLGPHEAAPTATAPNLANDNTTREQELFELATRREETDDEA